MRSSAWIWDFSSTHSTIAFSGGARYKPDDVGHLGHQLGSVENLNVSDRHGATPYGPPRPRHRRCSSTPSRAASNRDDQCVTPSFFGGGFNVSVMIRS